MKSLMLLPLFLVLGGCATAVSNTDAKVSIITTPVNAAVSLDNKFVCNSPCEITVTNDSLGIIILRAPGYKTKSFILDKQHNNASLGNLALGVFYSIGDTVDSMTGSNVKYVNATLKVSLTEGEGGEFVKLH